MSLADKVSRGEGGGSGLRGCPVIFSPAVTVLEVASVSGKYPSKPASPMNSDARSNTER
jgi:hypothetical protein